LSIITTQNLSKKFEQTSVLQDISIEVLTGDIYGFLGLNGAGKTTFIRMLLGMIQPTAGNIQLFGHELNRQFNRWNDIGYLVETPYSYPNLTVVENLKVCYQLRQLTKPALIEHIIEKLKLGRFARTKAKHLSLGNQQRLGLAKALMHRPKLLILDEPINGLDPEGIVEVRELLKELADDGSTILLSSHILSEISKVANQVAIIHQGKLMRELTIPELEQQLIRKVIVHTADNKHSQQLLSNAGYATTMNVQQELELSDTNALNHPEQIAQFLVEKGIPPSKIFTHTENLEMYFLRTIKTS
jgi:ABC-2 type transport system ATP-binding protein